MSGITLSASVRQNLLSLQSTADLLSTTQNRLATGNKVNSALDNPTNFFTAQGLNNRASDINNLLDGIGNGVQILQAANTGITSLQKLVDSAKSIANQALQATTGYSTKSNISVELGAGATGTDLFGGASYTAATLTGSAIVSADTTTPAAISNATALTTGSNTDSITATIANGDTLSVNGKTITFKTGAVPAANTLPAGSGIAGNVQSDGNGNSTVYIDSGTLGDLGTAIDLATGVKTASITNAGVATYNTTSGANATTAVTGALVISTGTASDLSIKSSNSSLLASLGIGNGTATTSLARTPATTSNLAVGAKLEIAAVGNGVATDITFGRGEGQVSNLNDLNAKLAGNNLQASIDTNGKLTITTNNDNASLTIGATTGSTGLFDGKSAAAPVKDANAQATRASLVAQYNTVLDQIKTTAADSSFNGVNLLNGDTLALTFNETGKSKLNITGVTFDTAGLGLNSLANGTDFLDNSSANKVLTSLNDASSKLRSQASAFGSNLSVVQLRQDFSKNLINVLQNGASALTLADTNEEAANSQALSTRQSIAVSSLALANQSQQGVLQLLR